MPKKTGANQQKTIHVNYGRGKGRGRKEGPGMNKTATDLLKQLGEAAEKQKKQNEVNKIAQAVALALGSGQTGASLHVPLPDEPGDDDNPFNALFGFTNTKKAKLQPNPLGGSPATSMTTSSSASEVAKVEEKMRAEQQMLMAQISSQKGELQCLKEMILHNKFHEKPESEISEILHDNEVRNSPMKSGNPVGWVPSIGKMSSSRKLSATDNIFGDLYDHVELLKVNNTWTQEILEVIIAKLVVAHELSPFTTKQDKVSAAAEHRIAGLVDKLVATHFSETDADQLREKLLATGLKSTATKKDSILKAALRGLVARKQALCLKEFGLSAELHPVQPSEEIKRVEGLAP